MAQILALAGWEKFQHYKDRDPPWVKLYRDLLTAESWLLGTDLSRLVQVASILLAARYSNKIPLKWQLIQGVAHLSCKEGEFHKAVAHLVEHKFLEIQELPTEINGVAQDASTLLATCSSEKRREETDSASAPVDGLNPEAWEEWNSYRSATKKPIKGPSVLRAKQQLAAFGAQQAAVVRHSIANSYQGLFAPTKGKEQPSAGGWR